MLLRCHVNHMTQKALFIFKPGHGSNNKFPSESTTDLTHSRVMQLASSPRLPCQHLWFFRLQRTQSISIIYNKFHTCILCSKGAKKINKSQAIDNLSSFPVLQIYRQLRSDWFTSVSEQRPLPGRCMAALYANQEQQTCLFTAAEGIHSLDFRTGGSDILNTLHWEMSSNVPNPLV